MAYPLIISGWPVLSDHILFQRFSSRGKKHRIGLFWIHTEAGGCQILQQISWSFLKFCSPWSSFFSQLNFHFKLKTRLSLEATVIRSSCSNFGNPAILKSQDPCLHAVVHFSIQVRLYAVLRFGTQAWLSPPALPNQGTSQFRWAGVPRLLVVWLYRFLFFNKKISKKYTTLI